MIGNDSDKEKTMRVGPKANRPGIMVAHDLRDREAVRRLELLSTGFPTKYTKVEAVTDDLVVLHIYPGAALDLPRNSMQGKKIR